MHGQCFKQFLLLIWALGILLGNNRSQAAVPTFSNIGVPINVAEEVSVQTLLDTFTVTDPDAADVTSCNVTGDNGEFFLLQDTVTNSLFELYLVAGAGLDFDNTPSYSLVVYCEDTALETGSATINVNILPNQAPTIISPSAPVNVGENEVAQSILYTLTVSDAENDSVSCDIGNVNPTTTAFGLWQATTDYEVYLLPNPGLDYGITATYSVKINCWDSYGSSQVTLIVDVIPNAPPTFYNLPTSHQTLDASTTTLGTAVYTIQASDNDSATIFYSLLSNPPSPDLFTIDAVLGEITTSKDLVYAVDTAYSLEITVSDGQDAVTEYLIVDLTNVNSAPIIDNLPDDVYFDEDIINNTLLFTLTSSDADGDSVNVTYTVAPSQYTSKFTMTNNNRLWLTTDTFNYEECSYFVLEFTASDGLAETTGYFLTITINDINEECAFNPNLAYITLSEGNSGSSLADPGLVVIDEDVGDTYSLFIDQTFSTESSFFAIDPSTGVVTFALNYDVDTSHPSSVDLIVVCTDAQGLTGTATVNVTILDVNDNVPLFTQVGYLDFIDQYDGPASTVRQLGTVNSDIDSGLNAQVEFTWTSVTSGSNNYFHLTAQGVVLLTVDPTTVMQYGDVHRFVVTATDKGTPPLSSTAVHDIMYRFTNLTTTTTTTSATTTVSDIDSFWDIPANIALVVIGAILGLLLLALLAYLFYKYCYKAGRLKCWKGKKLNCCKQKVGNKPKPKTKPFDFWNRKDDVGAMKKQDQGKLGHSDIGGVMRYGDNMPTPNV